MKTFKDSNSGDHFIYCPGCDMEHGLDHRWTFNGNLDRPTFRPSLLVTYPKMRCHSFITAGRIEFLQDSTHHLSGQTVDLPEIEPFKYSTDEEN